jgi:hypothetical protein
MLTMLTSARVSIFIVGANGLNIHWKTIMVLCIYNF